MDWIGRWWRQPDHYQWLSSYLATRKLLTFTRYMMAIVVATLGLPPVLMLFSPSGPADAGARGLSIAVAAACAVMALSWAVRWPTARQSSAFTVVSVVCITVTCLILGPGSGMQGCTAFAALAGYVAFFHTARYLFFTLSIGFGTALLCAAKIAVDGDPLQAISKLIVLVIGILAVPFAVQVMVHTLGLDALRSDMDSLTDLPNRRGFRRSAHELAMQASLNDTVHFTVVMVDLDDFKLVNDTAGHAAGDRTLRTVGDILRRLRPVRSALGRIGGEEFVVAVAGDRRDALRLAERVRREIAEAPAHVTASVGVASTSLFRVVPRDIGGHVDRLLEAADRAMYRAKRSGGDRVLVVGRPSAGYVEKPTARRPTTASGTAQGRIPVAATTTDPTPAGGRAAATRIPPEIVNATPPEAWVATESA